MSENRVKNYLPFNKKTFFYFDNKKLLGYEGETLASALIANGIKLVGRSFKYHRPRGIMALGTEEPCHPPSSWNKGTLSPSMLLE